MGQFATALRERTEQMARQVAAVPQEAVIEFARIVIPRSPVDTGLFRTNWMAGIGGINRSTTTEMDRTGGLALRQVEFVVRQAQPGETLALTNSLEYGRKLEYGYSKQAPQGFNRITASEWSMIVKVAIARARNIE